MIGEQQVLLATTELRGLVELARDLSAKGWRLTCLLEIAKYLSDAGVEVGAIQFASGSDYDLVVCNLPNFQAVVDQGPTAFTEARQEIDIDRVSILLSAISHYPQTMVLVSPADYKRALECLDLGEHDGTHFRRDMATKAAKLISQQTAAIAAYFALRNDIVPEGGGSQATLDLQNTK